MEPPPYESKSSTFDGERDIGLGRSNGNVGHDYYRNEQRAYRESKFRRNPEWPQNGRGAFGGRRFDTTVGGGLRGDDDGDFPPPPMGRQGGDAGGLLPSHREGGTIMQTDDAATTTTGGADAGRMMNTSLWRYGPRGRYDMRGGGRRRNADNNELMEAFRSTGGGGMGVTSGGTVPPYGPLRPSSQWQQQRRQHGRGREIGFETVRERQDNDDDNDDDPTTQWQRGEKISPPPIPPPPPLLRRGANIGEGYTPNFRNGSRSGGYNYNTNNRDFVVDDRKTPRRVPPPRGGRYGGTDYDVVDRSMTAVARNDPRARRNLRDRGRRRQQRSRRSYGTDIRDYDDDGRLEYVDYYYDSDGQEDLLDGGYEGTRVPPEILRRRGGPEYETDDFEDVDDRRPGSSFDDPSGRRRQRQRPPPPPTTDINGWDEDDRRSRAGIGGSASFGGGPGGKRRRRMRYVRPEPGDFGYGRPSAGGGSPEDGGGDEDDGLGRRRLNYFDIYPPVVLEGDDGGRRTLPGRARSDPGRGGRVRRGADYDELGPPVMGGGRAGDRGTGGTGYDEPPGPPTMMQVSGDGSEGRRGMDYDELGRSVPTFQSRSEGSRGSGAYYDRIGPPTMQSSKGQGRAVDNTNFVRASLGDNDGGGRKVDYGESPRSPPVPPLNNDDAFDASSSTGERQWPRQQPRRYGASDSFERQQLQKESSRTQSFGSSPQYRPGRSQSDVVIDDVPPYYETDRRQESQQEYGAPSPQFQPGQTSGSVIRKGTNPIKKFLDKLMKPAVSFGGKD